MLLGWLLDPMLLDVIRPHGLQHARLPCPSPSPRVCPSSCSLHRWCCPAISSSDMFIASVMPSSHLILWCPLLLLPSIFPSIRDFSNESSVRIRWPKYWSFSFSISPSSEHSGLISLKIDWFDKELLSKGLSGVFSSTTVQRHQFSGALLLCGPVLTTVPWSLQDHSLDYMDHCRQNNVSAFQHTVYVCHWSQLFWLITQINPESHLSEMVLNV